MALNPIDEAMLKCVEEEDVHLQHPGKNRFTLFMILSQLLLGISDPKRSRMLGHIRMEVCGRTIPPLSLIQRLE